MPASLNITQQFDLAAEDDPQLQEKPAISIEAKTFEQILEPIENLLKQNYINGIRLSQQMAELRQICSEAQLTHKTDDPILKQNRNKLLNTLQGFLESLENENHNFVSINFDDIFNLQTLTDVIRSDAAIYREFMNEPLVAEAIDQVSYNIEAAQKRNWRPDHGSIDINIESSNDETYDNH